MADTQTKQQKRDALLLEAQRRGIEVPRELIVQNIAWPDRSVFGPDDNPVPFHRAQDAAWDAETRYIAMLAGTQGGKGLDINTEIPTPTGFKRMGDIQKNDEVLGSDGLPCKVTYVSPVHHRDCFQVSLSNGAKIVCDDFHLWALKDNLKNGPIIIDTSTLFKKFIDRRYSIKMPPQADQRHIFLNGITRAEAVPTVCITVNSPDNLYLATRAYVPTHNTVFGPFWLKREIELRGGGDYIAVTASYDLFKLKMLPAFLRVFTEINDLGRFWAGDKIFELRDPATGAFLATRATDRMWGRVILRSANAPGGLESATVKAAWLDEAGQDDFDLTAWRAVKRRTAIYRARVLITTTLYNLGWLKQEFIDDVNADSNAVTTIETIGEAEINIVRSEATATTLVQYDSIVNPTYPLDEFASAKEKLPEDEFQMQYRGRTSGSLRGQIYGLFNRHDHVIEPFEIPEAWPRYAGIDFGGVNMVALMAAEDPNTGILYFYKEYLNSKKLIGEHVQDILEGEAAGVIPTAYGGATSEDQWRMEFESAGLPIAVPIISSVEVGILRVYSQLKLKQVKFFSTLYGTIDQFPKYRRPRDKNTGEILPGIADKAKFHYLDCARYLLGSIRDDRMWSQGMSS